ncbi:MAG: hypothetical protein CEE38_06550 [Planctomycetes bacterium B3_Pla]|nr:MAG: hypothetical protein CEE38_06550 [Planctomycetes bacterium B3_Pla]
MGMLTHGGLPCMQVSPGRLFLTERRLIWYKWGKMKSVDSRSLDQVLLVFRAQQKEAATNRMELSTSYTDRAQ